MNSDEIIPPSPQVKLKKSKSRFKYTDPTSSQQRKKKRPRTILSLRAKKLNETSNGATSTSSSGESAEKNGISDVREVHIYAGIDNVSTEDKLHTESLLQNFDILGQSKLIEKCNESDLSQRQEVNRNCVTQPFSQARGLISLRELVSTQNDAFDGQSARAIQTLSPNVQNGFEDEAKDVSRENFQFSELSNECNLLDLNISSQIQHETSNQGPSHSDSNVPSVVQSILNDFDFEVSSQEILAKSPPVFLNRRVQRKTYKRTPTVLFKTLVFDSDDDQKEPADCDIVHSQCTQDDDIDLNSSRLIVENLTNLSTYFTQPKSYVLDFNTNLSHTIPDFELRFDEFVSDSDDFPTSQMHTSLCDDEVSDTANNVSNETISESIKEHYTNTELLNMDDDILMNFDTPKGDHRLRKVKRNPVEISTPLSSTKAREEDSGMQSTPSTSKQAISSEQFVPKRLHFGAEVDQIENTVAFSSASAFKPPTKMPGFSKASGNSISTLPTAMKRSANIFANIDNDYRHIDPTSDDKPNPKRAKQNTSIEMSSPNRTCDSNRKETSRSPQTPCSKFGGFRLVSGKTTKLTETATIKARNIFGEDLRDLECHQPAPAPAFKPAVAGPSNATSVKNGFTTSRGGSIKISTAGLQRFGQMLEEVDRSVREEFGAIEKNSTLNDNALACKTPLAKLSHRSNAFATSTPNPGSAFGFKNSSLPPITPINQATRAEAEAADFSSLIDEIMNDGQSLDAFFESNTQQIMSDARGNDASMNLNDTISSDIQPINDSITEKGIDVLKIAEEVKCERRNALIEQQAECFKKSQPIRPFSGWLSIQKILSSKKLIELGTLKTYKRGELERLGVQSNVIDLNITNVMQLKFDMWHFYPMDVCQTNTEGIHVHDDMRLIMDENSRIGIKELTSAFLECPSVDPKLVPDHWIENAFKWICIKLASYERSFPSEFSGRSLTPENVLAQLKYRYDQEIDKVKRSPIRKIVEKDDTATKRMVLFVSRILEQGLSYSLVLCDGWYAIRTSGLDTILTRAITSGKIVVGTKLMIQGAELLGIEEGCSPLEMPGSVALKISANSTRRTRWYTKLGYCKEAWPFAVSLNSVYGSGGVITRTKAFVLRVYPLVFAVKEKSGENQRTVFRSNKVEKRQGKKDDKRRFEVYERFYSEASEQVEKEYERQRRKNKSPKKKLCDIDDGEELWDFMENSNDGICMEMDLSLTQRKLLDDYHLRHDEEKQARIAAIVKEKLNAIERPAESTPLQKVRLIDATSPNASKTAILSIWNVNDSSPALRENTFLDLRNITTNGMRARDILLTANSYSVLREVNSMSSRAHEMFMRRLTPLADIDPQNFKPHFNEFDTLGFVLRVDEPIPNQYQCVFIADASKNILCIKFWGSVQQCAYDDIMKERSFVVISQLEWRSFARTNQNGIPQAFVTEITTISENPKSDERAAALKSLREQLDHLNLDDYMTDCIEKLSQSQNSNKENASSNIPSKPNESTSNQTMPSRTIPASSTPGKPVLGVQQRIELLQNYGTPPAFRGVYLKHSKQTGSARKPFKQPTIN